MLLSLSMMAGALTTMANDYPYLTFETADGKKTSVSTTSLTISFQDGKLMAGSMELTLNDLNKMYFSTTDETTGIETISIDEELDLSTMPIYDLQGRLIPSSQAKKGVYIIKTKNGAKKVVLK